MADGTDENVYVVAPGVTVYGIDNEFHEGEVITPADVGSLMNFRTLVALGKIVVSDGGGGDDPDDDSEWNYTSIDDKLDATSPNPVENRALTKVFDALDKRDAAMAAQIAALEKTDAAMAQQISALDKTDAAMAQQIAALEEAKAVPIPQEDIRNMWNDEETTNGGEVS